MTAAFQHRWSSGGDGVFFLQTCCLECTYVIVPAHAWGQTCARDAWGGAVVRWCGGAVVRWCGGAVGRTHRFGSVHITLILKAKQSENPPY
jgi:hypothetical protein